MSEKTIQTEIMLSASQTGAVVFRNNVANGLVGQMQRIEKDGPIVLHRGDWIVRNGRRIQCGLCPGSSDLIGWRSVIVTHEMVGRRVALFLGMEVKTTTGRPTDEQANFIQQVRKAGGLAGIVRSVDDAIGICNPLGVE